MTNDYETCYLCGDRAVDMHHIFHGADKKISEETGCMIPLCRRCHERVHHVEGDYDLILKQSAQRVFLQKVFGKCYL